MLPAEQTPDFADLQAMQIFRYQWQIYQKFLAHDYLSNRAACAVLHAFLKQEVARSFDFLDLACGDASGVVDALQGTQVAHYTGIDLSAPALTYARKSLEALSCPSELDDDDFAAAVAKRTAPLDIVWISLSLHHLETGAKLKLMRDIARRMDNSGAFLIYEPTRMDGEGRPAYLDRFEAVGRKDWTALSIDEFNGALSHVRNCDLPETVSDWIALGQEAGFAQAAELYCSPDSLFRMFSYRK